MTVSVTTIFYFNKEMMLQQQKFPVVVLINEVFAVFFCSRDNKFFVKMKNPFLQCVDYFLDVF